MTDRICRKLYEDYYAGDRTPQGLVSSHWQNLHAKAEVDWEKGPQEWRGFGFGDLQYKGFHHKILAWLTICAHWFHIPNRAKVLRLLPRALKLAWRMNAAFLFDEFRQICTLALLQERIEQLSGRGQPVRILVIGDGFGYFSALLKDVFPNTQICLVDLGKTLFFQAYYLQRALPKVDFALVYSPMAGASYAKAGIVLCPAQYINALSEMTFDLVTNIVSMQEMKQESIKTYFQFIRSHLNREGLFYCCNRLEKVMPGGEVARLLEYPWDPKDEVLLDGPCPWHQYYLGWHPTLRGPKFLGVRWPLVNYYDGPIHHRLVRLRHL